MLLRQILNLKTFRLMALIVLYQTLKNCYIQATIFWKKFNFNNYLIIIFINQKW